MENLFEAIMLCCLCVGMAVIAPVEWTFALYVVGAYLSYTAAIFSFPQFGEKNEVSENE